MARLKGTISIHSLPRNHGLIINLCLQRVHGPDSPSPFNENPGFESDLPLHRIIDIQGESSRETFESAFELEHPPGHYFVQVRVRLHRKRFSTMVSQSALFNYGVTPIRLEEGSDTGVAYPMAWPSTPLEELGP